MIFAPFLIFTFSSVLFVRVISPVAFSPICFLPVVSIVFVSESSAVTLTAGIVFVSIETDVAAASALTSISFINKSESTFNVTTDLGT